MPLTTVDVSPDDKPIVERFVRLWTEHMDSRALFEALPSETNKAKMLIAVSALEDFMDDFPKLGKIRHGALDKIRHEAEESLEGLEAYERDQ